MNNPKETVRLGAALVIIGAFSTMADSGIGANSVLILGLGVLLLILAFTQEGRGRTRARIPDVGLSALALVVSLATLLETWGVDLRFVRAHAGVGPYLSAIGAAIALYGSTPEAERGRPLL